MVENFTKSVDKEMIKLKDIELSAEFFEMLEKSKKQIADKRGYDVSYGQYIEEMTYDFIYIIETLNKELNKRNINPKVDSPMYG